MKKILSYIFIASVFYFLFSRITSEWDTIKNASWNITPLNLVLILILSSGINFINALTWHTICKGLGQKVSMSENVKTWIYSNTARFLPGGVWQYPARILLSKKSGVSSTLSGSALLLESAFNLGVGILVTLLLGKVFLPVGTSVVYFLMSVVFCTLVLFTSKSFTGKVIKFARSVFKKKTKEGEAPFALQIGYFLPIILLICLQFTFAGSILFILVRSLADISISNLYSFVPIYSASWILGYVTILAPAGLGIQELSISTLLTPFLPASLAAVIAVLFRLALLAGEILTIGMVSLAKKHA